MSSTSNITISLQSNSPSKGVEPDKSNKNSELDKDVHDGGFDKALAKAQSDQSPNAGKELPKEDVMRDQTPASDENIQVEVHVLQTRQAGKINLLTAPQQSTDVSDESLIAFMQDQGFSRADMAQLLMARSQSNSTEPQLTASWFKMKSGDAVEIQPAVSFSEEIKPANLAEALATQLIEPKQPIKSSAIVEILAVKDASQFIKTQILSESSDQLTIKLSDLLPALARKPLGGGQSSQGSSSDSGSFSSSQFDTKSLAELAKTSGPQEFREFLAEHLKRAESLRELTDKLGGMVARQIAGQIGRGRWSLEIAMHPAELGSIEIDMEMTERGLEASFRASHSVTRDLLMESMPRLKTWFEEGGIDVAYAGLTEDSGAQNGGNSTGEQHAQSEVQTTESEESSDLTDNQSVGDGSTGLDIRV
jgi:flagellar hook-length control protein FliK